MCVHDTNPGLGVQLEALTTPAATNLPYNQGTRDYRRVPLGLIISLSMSMSISFGISLVLSIVLSITPTLT